MTGIGTHAKACQLRVNLGAAGLCVLVLFEHQHTSTFAQHKTITVLVPGARSRLGVVVARRERTHGSKAANTQRRYGGFRATSHDDVSIAVFNHATCFADAVQTCGAGCHDRQIWPLEAKTHGHMPCHHIDDGSRHEERRNTARAARRQFCVGIFDQRQAADTRANHACNACGQVFRQGFTCGQACVENSLFRSRNTVMNEGVHGARVFGAHVLLHIKSLDLTGNLAGEVRRVELGNKVNTGLAG